MRFDILTLFPSLFDGLFEESILKKAREKGLIFINTLNIRDNTADKHNTADDNSFGGGPGMVMKAEPIIKTIEQTKTSGAKVVYMSPAGRPLTQKKVKELSRSEHIVILCGHYEGIDERVMSYIDEEISIGDYVLTGGEIAAAVLIDAVSRYVPGVVKEMESVESDSFSDGLLDFPHYTRPADIEGSTVPDVLVSGNHEEIRKWRRKNSLERTLLRRPELLADSVITAEDMQLLKTVVLQEK